MYASPKQELHVNHGGPADDMTCSPGHNHALTSFKSVRMHLLCQVWGMWLLGAGEAQARGAQPPAEVRLRAAEEVGAPERCAGGEGELLK